MQEEEEDEERKKEKKKTKTTTKILGNAVIELIARQMIIQCDSSINLKYIFENERWNNNNKNNKHLN